MLPPSTDQSPHILVNGRDLGGLRTTAGGLTRAGMLYRTDAPFPQDERPKWAPSWPPQLVVDLRSKGEDNASHPWPANLRVVSLPLLRKAAVVTESASAAVVSPHETISDIYGRILANHPDRLARIVELAATSPGPVLIHCAAGKDRTGVAIALLLLAADVEAEEIVADYVMSAGNMQALLRRRELLRLREPSAAPISPRLLKSPRPAIELVVERLTGHPGGIPEWLERNGTDGRFASAWRDRFVEASGVTNPVDFDDRQASA